MHNFAMYILQHSVKQA